MSRFLLSQKFYRGNRGVCVTMLPLIADQPLSFPQRSSIYFSRGANYAALQHRTQKREPVFGKIRCKNKNREHRAHSDFWHDARVIALSAVLMLLTIMNEISFDVFSPLNWPELNWPTLNWHFANLPVVLLTVVSAGAPFLFSLERLAH